MQTTLFFRHTRGMRESIRYSSIVLDLLDSKARYSQVVHRLYTEAIGFQQKAFSNLRDATERFKRVPGYRLGANIPQFNAKCRSAKALTGIWPSTEYTPSASISTSGHTPSSGVSN